jgi:hypothetical protein
VSLRISLSLYVPTITQKQAPTALQWVIWRYSIKTDLVNFFIKYTSLLLDRHIWFMRGIYAPRALDALKFSSMHATYGSRHVGSTLPVWKPTLETHVTEGNWRQLRLIGFKRSAMWDIMRLRAFHLVKISLWWYFYAKPLKPCRASQRACPTVTLGRCPGSVAPQQWPWMASNDDADSARLCPSDFAIKSGPHSQIIAIETVSN